MKGRTFNKTTAEFGDCIRYIRPNSVGKAKFETRWEEGIFMEIRDESGEIVVGTEKTD